MWRVLLAFGIGSVASPGNSGLPVAPTDIEIGHQLVQLRKPLHAKSPGARLILFIRDIEAVAGPVDDVHAAIRRAVPPGSIIARIDGPHTEPVRLTHSGYTFHRGLAGIVLSSPDAPRYRELYDELEIESFVRLPGVRFVWLSRGVLRVEDLAR